MRRNNSNFYTYVFKSLLLVFGFIILQTTIVDAQFTIAVNKGVKDAILAEDWLKVADLLDKVDVQSPSPVLRVIKGHACLALNRNNESLRLFLSISSVRDIKEWEKWAKAFVNEKPNNAIAYYLKGDALARLGEYDKALVEYKKALELSRDHPLVLNGRGVLHACNRQLNYALRDFNKVTRSSPSFADAYVNLGVTLIRSKVASQAVLGLFTKALYLSPDFVLALNGCACVEFALGHLENTITYLKKANTIAEWYPTSVANMINFALMKEELMIPVGNRRTKIRPGTSIEAINKYVDFLLPEEARNDYIKTQHNLKQNKHFQDIGRFLSDYPPTEGPEWNEEVLNLLDRLKELEKRKRGGSPEEKEEIEKEIQEILEWLENLWNRGGKRPPLPPKPKEEDEEGNDDPDPEKGSDSKSISIHPSIIIVGKSGITIIPGHLDGNYEEEDRGILFFYANKFEESAYVYAAFWEDYLNTIGTVHPKATMISAEGVTAEDIIHAYVFKGKGLVAEYGLIYPIQSVKIIALQID